jgi:hypothetical protein
MALKNRFRIVTVDPYGFNGREHHPHASDIGLTVTAVKMEAQYFAPGGNFLNTEDLTVDGHLSPEVDGAFLGRSAEAAGHLSEPDRARAMEGESFIWFYTCVTDDGRVLDMVDFELEVV